MQQNYDCFLALHSAPVHLSLLLELIKYCEKYLVSVDAFVSDCLISAALIDQLFIVHFYISVSDSLFSLRGVLWRLQCSRSVPREQETCEEFIYLYRSSIDAFLCDRMCRAADLRSVSVFVFRRFQ